MRQFVVTAILASVIEADHPNQKEWGYKELGADWPSIAPFCGVGKEQSPIDLNDGAEPNEKMEINGYGYMNYPTGKFITLTDHNLLMNFTDGEFQLTFPDGSMSLFEPLQLHFHSPSEHTVGGKYFDLEVHLVHQYKGTNGQLGAVIGIFFDREAGGNFDNPWISSLLFD